MVTNVTVFHLSSPSRLEQHVFDCWRLEKFVEKCGMRLPSHSDRTVRRLLPPASQGLWSDALNAVYLSRRLDGIHLYAPRALHYRGSQISGGEKCLIPMLPLARAAQHNSGAL